MSLTPGVFTLKREFKSAGTFRELIGKAETGDIVELFDPSSEAFQARCGSKEIQVRHMNSWVAVSAETKIKGQKHLWLYRYDGTLYADLGVHTVDDILPVANQGIATWKSLDEEIDKDSAMLSADTLTLIRLDGSEDAIFIGEWQDAESDDGGNIWIVQEKQFVRLHVTESGVERNDYFAYDPLFSHRVEHDPVPPEVAAAMGVEGEDLASSLVPPDYVVSGNSLWIHHPNGNFLRVGPDGVITTTESSDITKDANQWYAQDEWLAVLGNDEQTLHTFKDGTVQSSIRVPYDVGNLIAVGPLGAAYGTNWEGQYSYFLITPAGKNVLLADHDDGYFCVMVAEGIIMPSREHMGGSCLSLLVYK